MDDNIAWEDIYNWYDEVINKNEQLKDKLRKAMEEALNQTVYKEPRRGRVYVGHKQMLSAIEVDIEDFIAYIYLNSDKMSYYSIFDREKKYNVSQAIPYWINDGHGGVFGDYKGWDFLSIAEKIIKQVLEDELGEDLLDGVITSQRNSRPPEVKWKD